MSLHTVSYEEADEFVRTQQRSGSTVRWDGWTMVFFNRTDHGFTNPKGAFKKVFSKSKRRGGYWGMELRIAPDANGVWKVPAKHVKPPR